MVRWKLRFIQAKLAFLCLILIKSLKKPLNKAEKFIIKIIILPDNKEYGHLYK